MIPVSTVPSLRTTRWGIESLFLKTTIWPPALAGFGENDCEPLRDVMLIVRAEDVVDADVDDALVDDGADGVDAP